MFPTVGGPACDGEKGLWMIDTPDGCVPGGGGRVADVGAAAAGLGVCLPVTVDGRWVMEGACGGGYQVVEGLWVKR